MKECYMLFMVGGEILNLYYINIFHNILRRKYPPQCRGVRPVIDRVLASQGGGGGFQSY